jgi:hypothetical protein
MAYEERLRCVTMISGADYRDGSSQYRFVVGNGSNSGMVRVSLIGDNATGICQDDPNLNQASAIAVSGISKVIAGAAVTAGTQIMSDNQGRAIAATSGNWILGTAILGTTTAGLPISIKFDKNGKL